MIGSRVSLFALAALMVLPAAGLARDFRLSGSGVSMSSIDADADGDLQPGFVSDVAGVGSFGRFTQQSVGDTVFSGFCSDNEVHLAYIALTVITRMANGDLLYRRLVEGSEGGVCFNFVTQTGNFSSQMEIIGGTGRFEGATGYSVQTGVVTSIGNQNGAELSETGEIHLVRRDGDDED